VVTGTDERWDVTVDRDVCIGSGVCAGTAGRWFHLVGNHAEVRDNPVPADPAVRDAADSCPVEAILVRHAVSGEVIAPAL
jgi:ferredoxin